MKKRSIVITAILMVATIILIIFGQPHLYARLGFPLHSTKIAQVAQNITVKIEGAGQGSGVLIDRDGNIYTIVTNHHVVENDGDYKITIYQDNQEDTYTISSNQISRYTEDNNLDLAQIKFQTNKKYQVAKLGNSAKLSQGQTIYASGFGGNSKLDAQRRYLFNQGDINGISNTAREGYQISHKAETIPGMSGGAVLNNKGQLVGINGHVIKDPTVAVRDFLSIPIYLYLSWTEQNPVEIATNTLQPNNSPVVKPIEINNQPEESEENIVTNTNNTDAHRKLRKYFKAIELNPNDANPYKNRGNAYSDLEKYTEAIADYSKAIELDPNFTEAYNNRGIAYDELKKYTQALADYNKAIELDSNHTYAYHNRGNTYRDLKKYPQAMADYNKAIELDPNYANAYNSRGITYDDLKQYSRAIADYNKAIELDPNYTKAYNNRGITYDDLKKHSQAIADYNKAIKLDPNYANAYNSRGITYDNLKKHSQAIADYNKAIEIDPNYANAYNNRGVTYNNLKKYSQAMADYSKAIKLAPNHADAYRNRGITYKNLKKYPQAIADYSKAIELAPNYTDAYNSRGVAYDDLKKYSQAIADYSKSIELDPNHADVYYNRGNTYRSLENIHKRSPITLKQLNSIPIILGLITIVVILIGA